MTTAATCSSPMSSGKAAGRAGGRASDGRCARSAAGGRPGGAQPPSIHCRDVWQRADPLAAPPCSLPSLCFPTPLAQAVVSVPPLDHVGVAKRAWQGMARSCRGWDQRQFAGRLGGTCVAPWRWPQACSPPDPPLLPSALPQVHEGARQRSWQLGGGMERSCGGRRTPAACGILQRQQQLARRFGCCPAATPPASLPLQQAAVGALGGAGRGL